MRTFGFLTTSTGVPGSLKEINPLDAIGNGSGMALQAGDCAVGIHDGRLMMHRLVDQPGFEDDGFMKVVPSQNAGNLCWVLAGAALDGFEGAFPGEVFEHPSELPLVAAGFSGGRIPWSELNFDLWNLPIDDPSEFYATSGFGIHDGFLYGMNGWTWIKMNLTTGVSTIGAASETNNYWMGPGHCLDADDGAELLITDLESPLHLSAFRMSDQTEQDLPYAFQPGVSWTTIFGVDNPCPGMGVRIGRWHYTYGKYNTNNQGFARVDCLTGSVELLPSIPSPGMTHGFCCVDFSCGGFWAASRGIGSPLMHWNGSEWSTHAATIFMGSGWEPAWHDEESGMLVVALDGQQTALYDIALDAWSLHDYQPSSGHLGNSYPVWYRDHGCIHPWGWDDGPNVYRHGMIRARNNMRIVKE